MRFLYLPLLLTLSSCYYHINVKPVNPGASASEPDNSLISTNITLGNLHHYNESTVTLSYTGVDQATSCSISDLSHLIETNPCSCTAGVCTVGVAADSLIYTGAAGFSYRVSSATQTSNSADASITIAAPIPFVTTWKTDNLAFGTSLADQIELPLESGRNYNFVVDWGDGSTDTISAWNDPATLHTYAIAGTYDVSITGVFDSLYFAASSDRPKILDVKSWGSYQWASLENTFEECRNLNVSATDAPNLTRVTSLARMFYNARSLNGDLSNWDTSNITDMSSMFYYAQVFNQNIGSWNTSKVTDISFMFYEANAFNQDISNWDTSNVENMSCLFCGSHAFNQPIGNWNTSKVSDMSYIFFEAFAFNQPIGNWDTSSAITMAAMFWDASVFNQDISNWDVSNVTQMEYMFQDTDAFNQPLGSWNTSNVISMEFMFTRAIAFNQPIGTWNTSNVIYMTSMFADATVFNQDISNWNIANVLDVSWMFNNATAFNQDLSSWTWSGIGKPLPTNTDFDTNAAAWVLPRPTW